jgi:hypothetical protein
MTVNLSSSLTGLSLLSGTNVFASTTAPTFESKAVRTAKAAFTLAATTPPWKEALSSLSDSSQVSAIKAMTTIIDKAGTGPQFLPADVQTAFTSYKALDRLRLLAEAASVKTASAAQRTSLQATFAKGLSDLQAYLAKAPTDKISLAFDQPLRNLKTSELPAPDPYTFKGAGLVKNRDDALPGLTGSEVFSVTLSRPGASDTVTVDLSRGAQPPTIDSVAQAINAAITAVPLRNPDGTVHLDESGNPQPRWLVHFLPDKATDKWGLKLDSPSGLERVTLDQTGGAKDALVVATGATALDAPTATRVFRLDDPAGGATRKAMATISALDRQATDKAVLLGKTTNLTTTVQDIDGKSTTVKSKTSNVQANTDAAAIATDAHGNAYVVGTTRGDLGINRSDGDDNLFLTKLDGEGKVMWQRSLGASGSSSGAAVSIASDGSIAVAGTVNGNFDGVNSDGDLLVAKFDANGNEKFATVIRAAGSDTAKALAVGADGSIFVGGRAATGGGDGFVARIDATGKLAERRTIAVGGSESVNGLAIGGDGNVLALVSRNGVSSVRKLQASSLVTDLGSVSLGTADARAIAVAADGSIAVGGASGGTLTGTQVNTPGGGRDGFVARIDAALAGASITYLATSEDDQVDSVAFMGGSIYAGGRTTGALGAPKLGAVDGFVARIDAASGAVSSTTQFGQSLLRTEPVRVAADTGGANSLSALGFARGAVNPEVSERLTTQTGLRPGDNFSIRVDGGVVKKLTITADDTLATLGDRIRGITGSKATITTPKVSGTRSLHIDAKPGHSLELLAGSAGADALAKLGIEPQRIAAPVVLAAGAPKVRPGGSFGFALSEAVNLSTEADAKKAASRIGEALSMSQTAYRSLYWDDGKARLVDGAKNSATGKQSTAREQAQLKNYSAALSRLSTTNTSFGF